MVGSSMTDYNKKKESSSSVEIFQPKRNTSRKYENVLRQEKGREGGKRRKNKKIGEKNENLMTGKKRLYTKIKSAKTDFVWMFVSSFDKNVLCSL